jgi:ABC-type sugar transport system substrate-binding protein
MSVFRTLALGAGLAGLLLSTAHAEGLQGKVIGFSQIGSESGWRAAETSVTKAEAEARGIDLKFADAQQKQENQIKAIRGFIAQGVDAILVAPVVATGWEEVLTEAKEASIPVVLLDRGIEGPEDLYMTSVASEPVQHRRASGNRRVVARDQPEAGLRGSHRRKSELRNHPQPDWRFHPVQGQGSDGRLPESRGWRQGYLRRLCPQ